jgi:hypothetical protein
VSRCTGEFVPACSSAAFGTGPCVGGLTATRLCVPTHTQDSGAPAALQHCPAAHGRVAQRQQATMQAWCWHRYADKTANSPRRLRFKAGGMISLRTRGTDSVGRASVCPRPLAARLILRTKEVLRAAPRASAAVVDLHERP